MNSSTPVSTQPGAITSPQSTARPLIAVYPPPKVRFRKKMNGAMVVVNNTLALIWIGLLVVPVVVLTSIGFIVLVGLYWGLLVSTGTIALLIGNGILRAAHLAHYTTNTSAASIGAVGSLISVFIIALLLVFLPKAYDQDGNEVVPWYMRIGTSVLLSTLSGTIGCAVLLHTHVDLGGIDVRHATCAGALGGAILGIGFIFILPLVYSLLFMFIFSPLWLAVSMGVEWVYVRSNEEWTERSDSHCYCYCYGTRGDDPDINAEIPALPGR